ncbi:Y-family DNA polymerase [Pedobacter paludis]|nr:DNA polymerase Y family protein [Pedobacter paludis]
MSIWFPSLLVDWKRIKRPEFAGIPLVFADKVGNRVVVTASSAEAGALGVYPGMPLADARAILPELEVVENQGHRNMVLLRHLGQWCIRYSPLAGVDGEDGLLLDISGCAHLWGGEKGYLKEIVLRLRGAGYFVRAAISDTIGASWAVARFGKVSPIVASGGELEALSPLPPMALRLEALSSAKLIKLGLSKISLFIHMPRSVLRRRIGEAAVEKMEQALGMREESFTPVELPAEFSGRLPCLEPVRTRTAIEIAIQKLLEGLCKKLKGEGLGLRSARLLSYRIDGKVLETRIGTGSPNISVSHLNKLFSLKIEEIAPGLGIELFVLEGLKVEDLKVHQESMWKVLGTEDSGMAELLDQISGKFGASVIRRYLPQPYHWPERSVKVAESLDEPVLTPWRTDRMRPVQLLGIPEAVRVSAPIPDYPPMLFIYRGVKHLVKKADGPERIEREWWLDAGEHRDYYQVEDEAGRRYWLFRSGHYDEKKTSGWFIHGFFA